MFFYSSKTAFLLLSLSLLPLSAADTASDISSQVKRVLPSVVKVKIQRTEGTDEENDLISLDGGGSGFVFDSDHHILTNAHVIKDAKKIVIIDHNHIEYPAMLVGRDDKTDIAVLEAPSFNAPNMQFKPSQELSIGEGVFVIGSPFSLGHSVSAGIISMTGRFLSNYPYIRFIQTDASINPGNSGGAMFDKDGNIIAMASTYYSKQGNYTNIGFGIPSEDIQRIGELLIRDKTIIRGFLGAELIYSEKISRKIGYTNGVYIARVIHGSPADQAGLKTGDLIIKTNGEAFVSAGELYEKLERSNPGESMTLTIRRNRSTVDISVTLGTIEDTVNTNSNAGTGDIAEKTGLILLEKDKTVKILVAYAASQALGLERDDKIISVNGTNIASIKEMNDQLTQLKESEIAMMVIERNKEIITIPFGKKGALKVTSTTN